MSVALFAIGGLWLAALIAARKAFRDPRWRLDGSGSPSGPEPAPAASVDVIVPARDEESRLGPCLDSLLAQTHRPARILVVDDRSTDGTAALVARFAPR